MNAIELLKTPFYISQLNTVMPLTKINIFYVDIYNYAAAQFAVVKKIMTIFAYTSVFITKELLKLAFVKANTEIVLYIMCIFSVFMFLVLNNQSNILNEQTQQIESLEGRINYLKKMERMREEMDQAWIKDIKLYKKETTNKMALMDRKIKKFEKDIKMYE
jgi:hypothetical protein